MEDMRRLEETCVQRRQCAPDEAEKQGKAGNPGEINVSMPHDKGYKKSLSRPGEFLHFLRKYVRAGWMMDLKESDICLCDKEMLERDYEGKEADLIYKVNMPDGKEAFIFLLQELQSYVDYTMIFRILVYVVNTLVKYFLDVEKKVRERAGFRLPAMVPIVFYNGAESWNAVTSLRDYQNSGDVFGSYILNLEYYLVNLADIEEEYILSTNTVLDNIMYCDKFRKKLELAGAIRTAYGRVQGLEPQEREEFRNWVKYILLSVCGNKEAVVEEILSWAGNGEDDIVFKYNIIRAFEDERAEGKAEGKAEDILDLLEEFGQVPTGLREKICDQKDMETLRSWHKLAARVHTIEEFDQYICENTDSGMIENLNMTEEKQIKK